MPMLQCSRIGARHGRNPCPRAKGRRAASFFQTVRRRSAVPALQTAEATRTILSTASASVQACSRFRRRNPKRTCVWGTGPAAIAGLLHLLTQLFLHCSLLLLLVLRLLFLPYLVLLQLRRHGHAPFQAQWDINHKQSDGEWLMVFYRASGSWRSIMVSDG